MNSRKLVLKRNDYGLFCLYDEETDMPLHAQSSVQLESTFDGGTIITVKFDAHEDMGVKVIANG